jgi:hypothetical protein
MGLAMIIIGLLWAVVGLGNMLLAPGRLQESVRAPLSAAVFALEFPLAALAADAPTGFRDIPFGASEADIKAKHPTARCTPREGGPHDDIVCFVRLTVGAVAVNVYFQLVGAPGEAPADALVLPQVPSASARCA